VAEAECTRCHPDLIPAFKERGDCCAEHDVPESQCALCNPALAAKGIVPPILNDEHAGHSHAPGEGHDDDVGATLPQAAESPIDTHYPGLSIIYRTNQPLCPTDQATIQFASAETVERAGIEVRPVLVAPFTEVFEAPAEVVFDQNATTTLTSTLPVIVTRWLREPGTEIHQGDAIATVESPDMALLQGEYLEAFADWQIHEREQRRATGLIAKGLIDSASYDREIAETVAAEARLIQSQSRLELAGLADIDLFNLRETGSISSRFSLRSTIDGILLERTAGLGFVLEPGTELARLGDPSSLWIEARIRESDLSRISLGQDIEFTADGNALRRAPGTVIWVAQFLDPHSRTATLRAKPTANTDILRAHEFGRVSITAEPTASSILVPMDAVQWEGCCNVVFVREALDRFHPRKVRLAQGNGGYYRILDGLHAGEEIVVGGSFLLKTELKKGSIGAGCCGLEATS
jgi:cobalt-zinc-cadmium efflux system membrane fusion protein